MCLCTLSTSVNAANKSNDDIYVGSAGYTIYDNEYVVWSELRSLGYSEIAVAGIMGNIWQESRFEPSAIEYWYGDGFGIVQWTGARKSALEGYAYEMGVSEYDIYIQIEFLNKELTPDSTYYNWINSSYGFTLDDLKYSDSIYNATSAFFYCYERANDDTLAIRQEKAFEYYYAFTGVE